MARDIVCFKLITGEEVIGTLINSFPDKVIILKARGMMLQQNARGQIGLTLIPWMVSAVDSEVDIENINIVGRIHDGKVPDELEQRYIAETSSIEIAKTL